ncbi:MAG: hypothetical protein ACRDVM_07195 [Acidimicrobiia bacterium]
MKRILPIVVLLLLAACRAPSGEDVPVSDNHPPSPGSTIPPGWVEGQAFVDGAQLVVMESFPIQVAVAIEGSLPTPCHQAGWEVATVGERIDVRLFSVADPEAVCAQVLQPFQQSVPLGSFESGTFEVWLNGERVGDFSA